MNILFFSQAAWDDKNSFGNTVSAKRITLL